jgi:hypothetical protein
MSWCGRAHATTAQSFFSREQSQADSKTHTLRSVSVIAILGYQMFNAFLDIEIPATQTNLSWL